MTTPRFTCNMEGVIPEYIDPAGFAESYMLRLWSFDKKVHIDVEFSCPRATSFIYRILSSPDEIPDWTPTARTDIKTTSVQIRGRELEGETFVISIRNAHSDDLEVRFRTVPSSPEKLQAEISSINHNFFVNDWCIADFGPANKLKCDC
nr:hypothetical protein [Abalone asfa-like virus]